MDPASTPDTGAGYSRRPGAILLAGLGMGVLASHLLWKGGPAGPGFAAWITLLAVAALWFVRDADTARIRTVALWSAVTVSAMIIPVFRSTPILIPVMWLVMIASAGLTLLQGKGITLRDARVSDHLAALLKVPLHAIAGAPPLLLRIDFTAVSGNPQLQGILRGIAMAIPLLLVFIMLFASADAAFSRYVPDIEDILSTQQLFMTVLFGWIAAGLLRGVSEKPLAASVQERKPGRLGAEETAVIMGLLTALFVVFVLLQLTYLFGGRETIQATTGLTVAKYARRGFFELVAVAGLTLSLLLALGAASSNQRLFRMLAAVLVFCVLVILLSAAQRLQLYTEAFGLTLSRIAALAFMAWLALNLLSFAAIVLRGHSAWFASGMSISGIVIALLLALANPAALVARVNIDRATGDGGRTDLPYAGFNTPNYRGLDIDYLLTLGSDTLPVLLGRLDTLPRTEQCLVAQALLNRWHPQTGNQSWIGRDDWRTWNASRAAAAKAVGAAEPRLLQILEENGEEISPGLPALARQCARLR